MASLKQPSEIKPGAALGLKKVTAMLSYMRISHKRAWSMEFPDVKRKGSSTGFIFERFFLRNLLKLWQPFFI